MKPELGRSYPTTWDGRPPHMAPLDLPLWRAYRFSNASLYTAFFYDAAVGPGTDPGPNEPDNYRYAWIRLTRWRIDVVGSTRSGWTLIEVRPFAGSAAIGSLMGYLEAWRQDPPDDRPVSPLLVTNQAHDRVIRLAEKTQIPIFTVQIPRQTTPA